MSSDPIPYWHSMTTVDARDLCARDPVVILPVASVEQHGPHLPLSTDLDIGLGLLREAFRRLPHHIPARVLPPLAVGSSAEHARFPGTVTIPPELLSDLIVANGVSLAQVGVRRLVISNSHGGNRHVVETAALRLRAMHDMLVVKAHYFLFPGPDDAELPAQEIRHGLHGGAVETAMMLFLDPDSVRHDALTAARSLGEDLDASLRTISPSQDAASFAWLADDLNEAGVTGDPTLANPALGRRLVEHYGGHLAAVIQDAKDFPIERLARR